jgi:hypothetical protein
MQAYQTQLTLNQNCEEWKVPSDHSNGHLFEDWLEEKGYDLPYTSYMEEAWEASITNHCATLRRIGWIDQKGRVYVKVPPTKNFDGGSLTPLLIDVREGD